MIALFIIKTQKSPTWMTTVTPCERDVGQHAKTAMPMPKAAGLKFMCIGTNPVRAVPIRIIVNPMMRTCQLLNATLSSLVSSVIPNKKKIMKIWIVENSFQDPTCMEIVSEYAEDYDYAWRFAPI